MTSFDSNGSINDAIETCDSLMALLLQEKEIIIAGETEKLAEYNQQKSALVEQLIAADKQLKSQFNDPQKRDQAPAHNWQLLQQKLVACQQQSSVNGAMINHCLKNTADALALLRGGTDNGASTYSNDGRNEQRLNTRSIAKI
jgi:flagellar biosynthesis/type III secretory pathway chaperone